MTNPGTQKRVPRKISAFVFLAWCLLSAIFLSVLLAVGQTEATAWALRIYSCVLTPLMVGVAAFLSRRARTA